VKARLRVTLASVSCALALASSAILPPAAGATGPTDGRGATAGAPAGAPASGPGRAAAGQPANPARDRYKERFIGRPAPDFTLSDLQGKEVRLSALRGKVVLLNFWYSSCGPCRREVPDLITLHRLRAKDGLEILGVNLDDILTPGTQQVPLKLFLEEYKVPYRVLLADDQVFDLYGGVPVQPISFVVDRKGTVVKVFWGAFPGKALDRAIAPYLAPSPARP
jgi:peroxiredoxin